MFNIDKYKNKKFNNDKTLNEKIITLYLLFDKKSDELNLNHKEIIKTIDFWIKISIKNEEYELAEAFKQKKLDEAKSDADKQIAIDQAVADLKSILENYKYDILADDALFTLARVTEENLKDKEKSMEYYRQLLKDYPGSIYGAQSRIRFRELRGDIVN
jgi:tetratricopeptide (TPR) repeat protein